jgi:hypothetical protein
VIKKLQFRYVCIELSEFGSIFEIICINCAFFVFFRKFNPAYFGAFSGIIAKRALDCSHGALIARDYFLALDFESLGLDKKIPRIRFRWMRPHDKNAEQSL